MRQPLKFGIAGYNRCLSLKSESCGKTIAISDWQNSLNPGGGDGERYVSGDYFNGQIRNNVQDIDEPCWPAPAVTDVKGFAQVDDGHCKPAVATLGLFEEFLHPDPARLVLKECGEGEAIEDVISHGVGAIARSLFLRAPVPRAETLAVRLSSASPLEACPGLVGLGS